MTPINLAALGVEEDKSDGDVARQIARRLVEGRSREDLLRLAGLVARQEVEQESANGAERPEGMPQTPDELWNYIVRRYGVRIARVSVCEDHDTPFDYVCAGFFEWYPNVFGIGPRGGGKSYDQALLHDLNSHWKSGCESATFGAVEEQAKRVYAAFKTFVDRDEIVGEPKISETNYKPVGDMNYGSKVEVLGGTVAAVNGPHPQKAHSDEVEIMRADTWRESRNLASAKTTPDGRHIKAQNYATSTMKWKGGRVWQILEAFKAAKKKAIERFGGGGEQRELVDDLICKTTTFYVMVWCIFEVAEQVPNCRCAPENADLPEWEPGMDRSLCKCDCVLPDTTIAINGELRAGWRRSYDGPVIGLVTASGKKLTVTPNHPVLTAHGWIAAGMLEVGYHVVSCPQHDPVAAADLDQVPPSAEDVFDSLLVQVPTGSSHTVSPLGIDFHGDALFTEGEVEFVRAEHELPLEGDAARTQQVGEHLFSARDWSRQARGAQVSQERVDRHPDFTSEVGRCLASGVAIEDLLRGLEDDASSQDAELVEAVLEHGLGDAGALRDGLVLLAGAVGGDDLVGDQLVGLGSQQATLAEMTLQPLTLAADGGGRGGDGHSGLVELDRLVEVEIKHWRGHVYNFSSSMESYSANGIVVHNCHEIVNGFVPDTQGDDGEPLPRTLESECQGRFYRSRGHRTRAEVIQLFLQNDARTWSAQQLCRETETEGLYIPNFSRNRHGLARFALDLANGPVYTGTDWGFTDEAAVLWVQYLDRAVEAIRYDGKVVVLPRGARVAISERTVARKTATELGQEAIMREIKLANVLSTARVHVRKRWADLQGAGDRRDWAKMGLRTARYSTRNFDEHVKEWRGLVDADRFFVVVDEDHFTGMGCPVLCVAQGELIETERGRVPIEMVRVGERVMTRKGLRRVARSGLTHRKASLLKMITITGESVLLTPDHRVWCESRQAWRQVSEVTPGDSVLVWTSSRDRQLGSSGKAFAGTVGRAGTTTIEPALAYTSRFGSEFTGVPSLMDTSSTIGMKIRETTTRTILNCSRALRTLPFITPGRPTRLSVSRTTAGASSGGGQNASRSNIPARTAAPNSRRSECVHDSAQTPVAIRSTVLRVEPAGRADVYDLSIEGEPEFFAGGILVHNCEQLEGWREEDGKESRSLPQHVVSAGRYVIYGMHDVYNDSGAQSPEQTKAARAVQADSAAPAAVPYERQRGQVAPAPAGVARSADLAQEIPAWRSQF